MSLKSKTYVHEASRPTFLTEAEARPRRHPAGKGVSTARLRQHIWVGNQGCAAYYLRMLGVGCW